MLDFSDIQGNILRGYRSFQDARFLYFHLENADAGTKFIKTILDQGLVTPADWPKRPKAATNIGISMGGLQALELNSQTLASFPPEFQEGMRERASRLGDVGDSAPENWDEPWSGKREVHLVLMCYSDSTPNLDEHCAYLRGLLPKKGGVVELGPSQDAAVLAVKGKRERIEHFGFLDGVSNPDVEGVPDKGEHTDTGNIDEKGKFRKVPIGEFLLGHRGEGGEVAPMPRPPLLVYNGTYLVLRKLQQDVVRFRKFVKDQATLVSNVLGPSLPAGVKPEDYLAAKMMGRWKDGSPLDLYPDGPPNKPGGYPTNAFSYAGDTTGARCPLGAHIRRANPRAALGFDGQIISRRRMIRRGIAYGTYLPEEGAPTQAAGGGGSGSGGTSGSNMDRGIMFLAYNASIERQFEFTIEQWLNFGDEFEQGDDSDPIAGTRHKDGRMVVPGQPFKRNQNGTGRMVIPGDERKRRPPFLCTGIPEFVTTKGGGYFFVPSMTGLRLLASRKVNI